MPGPWPILDYLSRDVAAGTATLEEDEDKDW